MPNEPLETKLEAAREAMAGEARAARVHAAAAEINARRREAQVAMESPIQKARRLERERMAAEAAEAARIHAALEAKHQADEIAAQQAAAERAAAAERQRAEEWQNKIAKAHRYESLIESVRQQSTVLVPGIRTLRADIERSAKTGSPTGRIVAARTAVPAGPLGRRGPRLVRVVIGLVTVILIVGSGGLLYYAKQRASTAPIVITPSAHVPLMFREDDVAIVTTTATIDNALAAMRRELSTPGPAGTIKEIRFVDPGPAGAEGSTLKLGNFLLATNAPLPAGLNRFLASDFMLGTYRGPTTTSPFFIFTVRPNSFNDAYGGMLRFEATAAFDVYRFWGLTTPPLTAGTTFKDTVIQNIDTVRVIEQGGAPILLYAFTNNRETLIITTSVEAFKEIVRRLTTPTPQT